MTKGFEHCFNCDSKDEEIAELKDGLGKCVEALEDTGLEKDNPKVGLAIITAQRLMGDKT